MKKLISLLILFATVCSSPIYPQDHVQQSRRGDGAGYSTRDATVLSMMGWGVGLAVGIALLCGYLENDTSHAH